MVKYALIYGYMGLTQKIDDQRVPAGYLECLQDENIIGKFEFEALFNEDRLQGCRDNLKEKGFRGFPERIEKLLLSAIPRADYEAERERMRKREFTDEQIEREMKSIKIINEGLAPDMEVMFAVAEVKKKNELLEKAPFLEKRYGLNVKIYTPL